MADRVWEQIERGAGTRLPFRALQHGDERCNRTTYGFHLEDRYHAILDDLDLTDLRVRDAFLEHLGGVSLLGHVLRHGVRPVTFVMHAFLDAAVVSPAWEALQRGDDCTESGLVEAQQRLRACSYAMAQPETGQLVPACVQHAVLDPAENERLRRLLPLTPVARAVP